MSASPQEWFRQLPWGNGVEIIKLDPHGLAALAKPAGVLSHPNTSREQNRALINAAYSLNEECFTWSDPQGERHQVWLLNRLDSATSGVILVSLDPELAEVMRLHFRQKKVRKIYNTLVFGRVHPTTQVWRDRLAVQKQGGQIRTSGRGNIPAECKMKVLQQGSAHALLQLEPITGRSHQLRVQCAKRHLPIVGDATYGDFTRNRTFAKEHGTKRLFLHSMETSFEYEFRGKRNRFKATAPLPPEFEISR